MGSQSGFTVWRGSALNCASNEIALLHRRFTLVGGATRECNKGSITGHSLRVENGVYKSQLSIHVTSELIGATVICLHEDTNVTSVGSSIITLTTG